MIWGAVWAPTGRNFATVSRDKMVKFWGQGEGVSWAVGGSLPKFESGVTCVDWTESWQGGFHLLAVGTEDGGLSVWSSDAPTAGWRLVDALKGASRFGGGVSAVKWRPGEWGATQLCACGEDNSVRVYTL